MLDPTIALLLGFLVGLVEAYSLSYSMDRLTLAPAGTSGRAPDCGHETGLLTRIPVLGYLLQAGKCQECGKALSFHVAVYETLIVAFCIWAFRSLTVVQAFEASLLVTTLIGIAVMDLKHWLIPNLYVGLLLLLTVLELIFGSGNIINLIYGLAVGVVVSLFLWIPQYLDKDTHEYALGDVKLVLAISLWLGWVLAIYGFFVASVLAFLVWLISGLFKGFSVKRRLPFGPFVALSALALGLGKILDPQFVTHLMSFRF